MNYSTKDTKDTKDWGISNQISYKKNTSHRSNNKWGFESPQNHPNTIITVTNKK
jgi:hypothetical protein